jgi:hypothetical protein
MLRDLQHGFVLLRRDAGVSTYRGAGRLVPSLASFFPPRGVSASLGRGPGREPVTLDPVSRPHRQERANKSSMPTLFLEGLVFAACGGIAGLPAAGWIVRLTVAVLP